MRKLVLLAIAIAVETTQLVSPATSQTLTINWEVENRFRFYRNATTFQYYASIAKEELTSGRADWILSTERKLQAQYLSRDRFKQPFRDVKRRDYEPDDDRWNGWASLTRDETCWDRQNFVFTELDRCEDFVFPVSHSVVMHAVGAEEVAQCRWAITIVGKPLVGDESLWKRRARVNDTIGSIRPCNQTVTVEVPWAADGSAYAEANVEVVGGDARSEPQKIIVNDILILGLGDSFAAGVGNPDKPAQMDWYTGITYEPFIVPRKNQKILPVRQGGNDNGAQTSAVYSAQSEWQDIRCFRSQYGPQFRTALHIATLMDHAAVTYLDLSCNGARIIEGLLSPKLIDSGYAANIRKRQPTSQIGLASRLLCVDRNNIERVSYKLRPAHLPSDCRNLRGREICEFADEDGQIIAKYQNDPSITKNGTFMSVCKRDAQNPFRRNVDVLLLSIGGNDIGFAPMVADVIIDNARAVNRAIAALGKMLGEIHPGGVGMQRLGLLKSKYEVLDKAISDFIPMWHGQKKPIFLSGYPLPLDDASGKLCGTADNIASASAAMDLSTVFAQFDSSQKENKRHDSPLIRLKDVTKTSCALNLLRFAWFDGGTNANSIIQELTKPGAICAGLASLATPKPSETNLGWQYVSEFLVKFRGHGFCALRNGQLANQAISIPTFKNELWDPNYNNMRPYDSRQRWIRTPNDAFVITNWVTGALDLADFDNLMASSTTTAMHPTAEGFAAMADSLFSRVTNFLCAERSAEFTGEPLCKVH